MFNTLKNYQQYEPTQREQLPGTVANSAGGYSFQVDDWEQFKRFLILGTTGGTYYIGERKLTEQNLAAVENCIKADGVRAVQMIKEISIEGRAPKNDPAIFALAMALSIGDAVTKQAAYAAVPEVCRTFTHLSHLVTFIKGGKMRGWGRGLCRAIANWYNGKSVSDLVHQVIKYGSRDGISQRDVYRLSHPKKFVTSGGYTTHRQLIYSYIAKGIVPEFITTDYAGIDERAIDDRAVNRLHTALQLPKYDESELLSAIQHYHLPMECIPTDKRTAAVYKEVARTAGLTWLLRNLGNMSKHNLFEDTEFLNLVTGKLTNAEQLKKARVHPINIFVGMRTYSNGKGDKGSSTWTPHRKIVDALDAAFYASFNHVEPSNKRICFAVDVSGSMSRAQCNGLSGILVFEAAAVMAMAASAVEPNYELIAFDTGFAELPTVSHRQRLDDIVKTFQQYCGGGTDCAIPFGWAAQKNKTFDLFVSFTDSETWAGVRHPIKHFEEYKRRFNPNAKAINVCMASNRFTTLPSNDGSVLEVVGFDASVPELISTFAK